MLIPRLLHDVESRSTAELTIDELSRIRLILNGSKTLADAEAKRKPRRGGIVYSLTSLLMAYMLLEIRETTYKGLRANLDAHDCACLGFPMVCEKFKIPSVGTLNNFANHILPDLADGIGGDLATAVLKVSGGRVFTIDSTPLEASRYNSDADYSVHYEIRMDKAHIVMVNGFPLFMTVTAGNAGDNPAAAPLIGKLASVGYNRCANDAFLADTAYDSFVTYADVWLATGCVLASGHSAGAVHHPEADWGGILKAYNGLRGERGFDPNRKNDADFVLRFLCANGRKELVGMHLRNLSMLADGDSDAKDTRRHVCEAVHRAMKRWMRFDIRDLRRKTRTVRIRCRFLVAQLLSALFEKYRSPA